MTRWVAVVATVTALSTVFAAGGRAEGEISGGLGYGFVFPSDLLEGEFSEVGRSIEGVFQYSVTEKVSLRAEGIWMRFIEKQTLVPVDGFFWPGAGALETEMDLFGGTLSALFHHYDGEWHSYVTAGAGLVRVEEGDFKGEWGFVAGPGFGVAFGKRPALALEAGLQAVMFSRNTGLLAPLRVLILF